MKPREERRNVLIKARMTCGASWSDALILNLSSRGMLVRADRSPSRGSYLEFRRGPHVIIGRVVWSNSNRFGVQTQDIVPAESLVRDPDGAAIAPQRLGRCSEERRRAPRAVEVRHEASRQTARFAEFAAASLLCFFAAILIGGTIMEVAAKPLDAARAALNG